VGRNLRRLVRALPAATALIVAVALSPVQAQAAVGDLGYQDQVFGAGPGTTAPTADKPESKLWFAYGSWWADLWSASAAAHHIFRLDTATQVWSDTGVAIDARPETQSTTLYDGNQLYIASHVVASSSSKAVTGNPTYLYRYTHVNGAWSLDADFPVTVQPYSVESLSFDIDGAGRLWAAYTRGARVYVTVSTGTAYAGSMSFTTPWVPAVTGANTKVNADDIATVTATAAGDVLVLWSNQADGAVEYARHAKGAADTAFAGGLATQGAKLADDHLNLKALQSDAQGRVFAGVKTGLNDLASSAPTDPLLLLLVFTPADGRWATTTFSTIADSQTRPLVLLDAEHNKVHMLATGPSVAGKVAYEGTIYEKVADLDDPVFPAGAGTPVIRDASSAHLNNATSTRQPLSSATGEVVLAGNSTTLTYWHLYDPLADAGPTASFTATPTSGTAPLTVQLTDTSTGSPSAWSWDYGDGTPADTGSGPVASHTYPEAGTYQVKLTVSNARGSSTATRTVTVSAAPPGTPSTLYRVNAGGAAITGSPGWTADTTAAPSTYTNAAAAYSGAETNAKTIDMAHPSVPSGTPSALLNSDRYDPSKGATMQWDFPVPTSGTYTVRLYFAETNPAAYGTGLRRFSVQAEGVTELDRFDIYAEAGKKTALVKTLSVPVTDRTLNLNFIRIQNNPLVNGIEVIGPA
jgi:PKD repeat protein